MFPHPHHGFGFPGGGFHGDGFGFPHPPFWSGSAGFGSF